MTIRASATTNIATPANVRVGSFWVAGAVEPTGKGSMGSELRSILPRVAAIA